MKNAKDKKPHQISRTHKPAHLTLEKWQVALRREFGQVQKFRLKNIGQHPVFSEFIVTNPTTERSYRVAVRGERLGDNFCSCPDFSVNTLGTCKHIEFTLAHLRKKRGGRKVLSEGFASPFSEVFLRYGTQRQVVFSAGTEAPVALKELTKEYFDQNNILRDDAFSRFDTFLKDTRHLNHDLRCYDDALDFIAEIRDADYRLRHLKKKFPDGIESKAFDHLLKTPLYPYQREGTLFTVQAGRVLIGDDMGLGKTIQAIAAVEIMAQEFGVEKVLIICPATLKYQWKHEIEKFSSRPACVIEGLFHRRRQLYAGEEFFKIVNYDVVFRDLKLIAKLSPDLVILDEAQRIKNWKTRTAQSVKQIKSPYAMVLTGTPLENRLEELHSIVEFIDRYRLGPMFQFLANHQVLDEENGKVVGYHNLKEIGQTLSSILIRRRKDEVLMQLPDRIDKNFFVPMTKEQMVPHEENREIVAKIVAKWRRYKFLSEAEHRRLMIALQYMRMSCDNTYLIDQETRFGPKLNELLTFLGEIFEEDGAKVVIFSQWQRMTTLVAELLENHPWGFVHLHGGVPSKKRKDLIKALHEDPKCRIFLSTDAGGVGLNLQAASAVINMDLPWNPAVLEQRIGRVHRLGQHRPVRVINFVSEGTIEHGMLSVLSFKRSLFAGVLDMGEDNVFLGKSRLNKFMESVETVTCTIPQTEHEPSPGEPEIPVQTETAPEPGPKLVCEPWQDLLTTGTSFLQALDRSISGVQKNGRLDWATSLETDKKSGKSYLKIPLPDKKLIQSALPTINSLLETLKSMVER
ncbi:MAG: DEAD/DEAH box helicase [Desulfobacterales bacterium]